LEKRELAQAFARLPISNSNRTFPQSSQHSSNKIDLIQAGGLHQLPLQALSEIVITMHRHDNVRRIIRMTVNMVTSADPLKNPAASFKYLAKVLARYDFHSSISANCALASIAARSSATSSHPSAASRILLMTSS
jgi:hypothetical protein